MRRQMIVDPLSPALRDRRGGPEPDYQRHGWMCEESFVSPCQSVNRLQTFVGHKLSCQLGLRPGMADDVELINGMRKNFRDD